MVRLIATLIAGQELKKISYNQESDIPRATTLTVFPNTESAEAGSFQNKKGRNINVSCELQSFVCFSRVNSRAQNLLTLAFIVLRRSSSLHTKWYILNFANPFSSAQCDRNGSPATKERENKLSSLGNLIKSCKHFRACAKLNSLQEKILAKKKVDGQRNIQESWCNYLLTRYSATAKLYTN